MGVTELLQSVQFVVDHEGKRKAVQVDLETWEELLDLLEDLEDAAEMEQARDEDDELIPWEQVVADYQTGHPDADV
jgi:hypothetical protein